MSDVKSKKYRTSNKLSFDMFRNDNLIICSSQITNWHTSVPSVAELRRSARSPTTTR